jgi:hypothetical protein
VPAPSRPCRAVSTFSRLISSQWHGLLLAVED